MASVLNRSTKQLIASANTPDYPVAQWIHNPDLSAVAGWPSKYWIITGDAVSLMSDTQRQQVDTAELNATRDMTSDRMNDVEDIVRALGLSLLDETNAHVTTINAILDAIDQATNLADLKTRVAAIADLQQRTGAQLRNVIRNKLGA